MGLNFGQLFRDSLSKKKTRKFRERKGRDGTRSREYVRRATRTIKKTIKEPEELPITEDVPAIRRLFEKGAQSP